ncbi:MAG: hypothetical protein ACRDP3_20360, partial [Streptomyces sp.]
MGGTALESRGEQVPAFVEVSLEIPEYGRERVGGREGRPPGPEPYGTDGPVSPRPGPPPPGERR